MMSAKNQGLQTAGMSLGLGDMLQAQVEEQANLLKKKRKDQAGAQQGPLMGGLGNASFDLLGQGAGIS